MVVHIINVERVRIDKAKNHAPVCANRYSPKSSELAFERMQVKTGHIHIGDGLGRTEPRENIAQLNDVFSDHTPRVIVFVKAFQSLVSYRPYQLAP